MATKMECPLLLQDLKAFLKVGPQVQNKRGIDNTAAGSPETSKRQMKPSIIKA
jgi:hypothetical protein